MTTRIWAEPIQLPDGRLEYVPISVPKRKKKSQGINKSGLPYRTYLGGPGGEVLCKRSFNPTTDSCRALLERGITGPFETWKPGIPYACMTGDIEKAAKLTVWEVDQPLKEGGPVGPLFRPYRPYAGPTRTKED